MIYAPWRLWFKTHGTECMCLSQHIAGESTYWKCCRYMCGWNSLTVNVDPYVQQQRGFLVLPVLRVQCSNCFISPSVSGKAKLHMTHRQGQLIALRPCAAASQAQVLLGPQGKGRAASARAVRKMQTSTAVSYKSTAQGEFCCYLHKLKTVAYLRGGYPADIWEPL